MIRALLFFTLGLAIATALGERSNYLRLNAIGAPDCFLTKGSCR